MKSSRTMRPADWSRIQHFESNEFAQPGLMGFEFMLSLDAVRTRAGVTMIVTSSHRSDAHNAEVGGAVSSAHTDVPTDCVDVKGKATKDDPHCNRWRYHVVTAALAAGCSRIGVYPNGSLHLDWTDDSRPAGVIWVAVDNPAEPPS